MFGLLSVACLTQLLSLGACKPEPPLYLYDAEEIDVDLPMVNLDLKVYWDYQSFYDDSYDWESEWYYGWDETDQLLFGEIGYTNPSVFNLRRYYTNDVPRAPHTAVIPSSFTGNHFQGMCDWGYWDFLCWNDITTLDGITSLIFDEDTSLDSVVAYTNETMHNSRYQAPRYVHSFYAPEALFAAYETAIDINRNMEGFTYDAERNIYVMNLGMTLEPVTYIYLTQVILHHNRGRITNSDGTSNLSGMARSTTLNNGRGGSDAITVHYLSRLKQNCQKNGEPVDIIGGRLLSFGMCNQTANLIRHYSEVTDNHRHYLDVNMQFNNGMDSTFVFDVTDQVRRRYKGGVITIELDMDTVPIPNRSGGSGFDAVVKPVEDGGTHEFEM